MATPNVEVHSTAMLAQVGSPAIAEQPRSTVDRSRLTLPMSAAEPVQARSMLAQARIGGVAMPARGMPVQPNRGGWNGGGWNGGGWNSGGVIVQQPYGGAYGYQQNTGLLGALVGQGGAVGITFNSNGISFQAQAGYYGGQYYQTLAPFRCIVQGYTQTPYGPMLGTYAIHRGEPIPPGFQVVMQNPDWWTWWTTTNYY